MMTDERIDEIAYSTRDFDFNRFARAIEAEVLQSQEPKGNPIVELLAAQKPLEPEFAAVMQQCLDETLSEAPDAAPQPPVPCQCSELEPVAWLDCCGEPYRKKNDAMNTEESEPAALVRQSDAAAIIAGKDSEIARLEHYVGDGLIRSDYRSANDMRIEINRLRAEIERLTKERWCPTVCPITGRPFFMWIEHYETGRMVPTYGGPFDSYTIPIKGDDGEFVCERYDHDAGAWLADEVIGLSLRLCDDQHEDYEFGTLAARDTTIAQQAERIAELEAKLPEIALNIAAGKREIAAQAALIERCAFALRYVRSQWDFAPNTEARYAIHEALAAIAAQKGGAD